MSDALSVKVALVGSPRWLNAGVSLVTALTSVVFVWCFAVEGASAWLGLFPGLTVGVFLGSALAVWARRRGGTAVIEATPGRLAIVDVDRTRALIDLCAPWAAVLFEGRDRRMLVVSQNSTVVALAEPRGVGVGEKSVKVDGLWARRTRAVDLDGVPLGASSANVFALATGESLGPMLEHLERTLEPDAPLVLQQLHDGEKLCVDGGGLTLGERAPLRGAIIATPYVIRADGNSVAALGLASVEGEGALLLVGCDEVVAAPKSIATESPAEAMLSAVTFAVLRAITEARPVGQPVA